MSKTMMTSDGTVRPAHSLRHPDGREVTFRIDGPDKVLIISMYGHGSVRGPRYAGAIEHTRGMARGEWRRLLRGGFQVQP